MTRHRAPSLNALRHVMWMAGPLLAAAVGLGVMASPARPAEADGPLPLRHVADLPLSGRATRFDHQDLDPQRHLLFIAHLGDSAVAVVDPRSHTEVASISDLSQVHGVLVIPELGRVYATATKAHQVAAIAADDFHVIATIPAGSYPDGLAYAPTAHKLYVSDKTAGALIVIDVTLNRNIGTIPLQGEVGNVRYDAASRHIFVNAQGRQELVEIDPATDVVLGRYPLAGAEGNHPCAASGFCRL